MADNKREYIKFITPRGVAKHPRLLKADPGPKGKEYKVPVFKTRIEFEPGGSFTVGKSKVEHDEIVAKLEAMRDAEYDRVEADLKAKKGKGVVALKKLHKAPVFGAVLDDEGNETGKLTLSAKTASEYEDKKTGETIKKRPPTMFDAKGKELKKLPPVSGGSEMKVAVAACPYFVEGTGAVGITYYLEATQLLKLVEFGGRSAADMGFGSEEGYSGEDDGDPGFSPEDDDSEPAGKSDAKTGDDF
jgi:hypothetical protein